MDPKLFQNIALAIPALLLSLSVHEYAHAWVATRLGDSTPGQQGRLTLSPLAHIDPIGTLLIPGVLLMSGFPPFGWAKPVQFNAANFNRRFTMKQGTALTALAGPLSNILLAVFAAIGLRVVVEFGAPVELMGFADGFGDTVTMFARFFYVLFSLNVVLAVFNLVPLPPLDGGHLYPASMTPVRDFLARYSFVLFLALFMLPIFRGRTLGGIVLEPVQTALAESIMWIVRLG